jgi:hypothetical protein
MFEVSWYNFLCLSCPVVLTLALLTSERQESSGKLSAVIPMQILVDDAVRSLEKSHLLVKHNRHKPKAPPSNYKNTVNFIDANNEMLRVLAVVLQSRSFGGWNQY